jgi:hypothetical protein
MPAAKQHKFAKGETLAEIAKKHGHGDARVVWSFAANKGLVGKRRQPEALEPGDLIAIPPTAKEAKERQARLDALDKTLKAEWALDTALVRADQTLDQRRGPLEDAQTTLQALRDDLAAAVKPLAAGLPRCADAVQAARSVVQAGAAAQAACKAAVAAARAQAGKLAKLAVDLRGAASKDLALGPGDLFGLQDEIARHERGTQELLAGVARCAAPLDRAAWWASHAVALRDLPAWSADAAADRAAEIGRSADAVLDACKQCWDALRTCAAEVLRLQRSVETQRRMSEMRRVHAGQLRAAED